ncbi:hypothetical protein GUJ93_ZPchr0011g28780 [Zizania palustris]|uniref:DUF6598 domain-containing protein n=1 Tax=Zizania palustris TaxID=103762 RepID=A0A8J6BRH3_ZIZPA|nr:hypothetical protein GUJ93_ZPchr0011g28780 [Zizania palustris]
MDGQDKLRFDVSSAADRQRFDTTFIRGVRSELGNTSRPVMLDALRLAHFRWITRPSDVSINVESMEGAVRGLAETSTVKEEKRLKEPNPQLGWHLDGANDVVQDPNTNLCRQFMENCRIYNAYTAAVTLGLVLTTAKANRRQTRAADDGDVALGLTLVEILRVKILNVDGESPGELYGNVTVTDSFSEVYVFDRSDGDTQSVEPDR